MMKNGWDLYESHQDFEAATVALDAAWEEAKLLAPEKTSKERAALAEMHVYGVMKKWVNVGALDSDPVCVLGDKVLKHFGFAGGWL